MYDEAFITQFMPKLKYLAEKYTNENYDENDLLSEGQIYLLEYLSSKQQNLNKHNLSKLVYDSVDRRLKTFVNRKVDDNTEPLTENIVEITLNRVLKVEELIQLLKDTLTDREYTIITLYYGIVSDEKTIKDIAKMYKVTQERIKQIKVRAEKKIKTKLGENGITCLNDLYF